MVSQLLLTVLREHMKLLIPGRTLFTSLSSTSLLNGLLLWNQMQKSPLSLSTHEGGENDLFRISFPGILSVQQKIMGDSKPGVPVLFNYSI